MLKRININSLPPYFLDEEKKAFVNIYNTLAPCKDALGLIPPIPGERTVFVVTEDLHVSRDTEEAIDNALEDSIVFSIDTISHDETFGMEGHIYVFK